MCPFLLPTLPPHSTRDGKIWLSPISQPPSFAPINWNELIISQDNGIPRISPPPPLSTPHSHLVHHYTPLLPPPDKLEDRVRVDYDRRRLTADSVYQTADHKDLID